MSEAHGPRTAIRRDPRVHLALERTLLAWARTGISLIGLGLILAKFVLDLGRLAPASSGGTRAIGGVMVAAGGLLVGLAGARHLRALARLRHGRPEPSSPALALALLVVIVGVAVAALWTILA